MPRLCMLKNMHNQGIIYTLIMFFCFFFLLGECPKPKRAIAISLVSTAFAFCVASAPRRVYDSPHREKSQTRDGKPLKSCERFVFLSTWQRGNSQRTFLFFLPAKAKRHLRNVQRARTVGSAHLQGGDQSRG